MEVSRHSFCRDYILPIGERTVSFVQAWYYFLKYQQVRYHLKKNISISDGFDLGRVVHQNTCAISYLTPEFGC